MVINAGHFKNGIGLLGARLDANLFYDQEASSTTFLVFAHEVVHKAGDNFAAIFSRDDKDGYVSDSRRKRTF